MDDKTYSTLIRLKDMTRKLLNQKYAKRKRLNQDEVWEKATTIRDITDIENWIAEVEKDYTITNLT